MIYSVVQTDIISYVKEKKINEMSLVVTRCLDTMRVRSVNPRTPTRCHFKSVRYVFLLLDQFRLCLIDLIIDPNVPVCVICSNLSLFFFFVFFLHLYLSLSLTYQQ